MIYTVIWRTSAENELKQLWATVDDPEGLLDAARQLEGLLLTSAHRAGESRHNDDHRIIFKPPLGMRFWVSRLDRVAAIEAVWWIGRDK